METFHILMTLATFMCSLVAGFLFAFAIVTMPGIRSLSDPEFIRAFQVMDRVIQNNQPIFIFVWIGSAVFLVTSALLGIGQLDGVGRVLITLAVLIYLFGVQLPTIAFNIPLNNKLQNVDADAIDEMMLKAARQDFEPRWNLWNAIRAIFASVVSVLLIILILRI